MIPYEYEEWGRLGLGPMAECRVAGGHDHLRIAMRGACTHARRSAVCIVICASMTPTTTTLSPLLPRCNCGLTRVRRPEKESAHRAPCAQKRPPDCCHASASDSLAICISTARIADAASAPMSRGAHKREATNRAASALVLCSMASPRTCDSNSARVSSPSPSSTAPSQWPAISRSRAAQSASVSSTLSLCSGSSRCRCV
mmetsp:Transcript_8262/g.27256  ORF Transcript_8262/g.27256 Transcript_8262/m.27256 type:complete len:200 (-) Transcript_8262:1105-1704(-)